MIGRNRISHLNGRHTQCQFDACVWPSLSQLAEVPTSSLLPAEAQVYILRRIHDVAYLAYLYGAVSITITLEAEDADQAEDA